MSANTMTANTMNVPKVKFGSRVSRRQVILIILLLMVVAFTAIREPGFLSANNAINIALQTSQIGLMACGMTYVMVAGGIDLSVGSVLALGAAVAGVMLGMGLPVFVAIGLAIIAGVAVGAINGYGIAYLNIPPLILTLGVLYAVRGGILLANAENPGGSTIATGFDESFLAIGQTSLVGVPVPAVITILGFIIAHVVLTRMRFGRYTTAVGTDLAISRRAGIGVNRHLVKVYAVSGALAAVSGVLLTAQVNAASTNVGQGIELTVIAAVVIGGTALTGGVGSITGTLLGVLFLSVAQNALDILNVSPFAFQLAVGVLLLISAASDVFGNPDFWRKSSFLRGTTKKDRT